VLDDAIEGDDLVGGDEENGEQLPLLGRGDVDRLRAVEHLQRSEDPELHHPSPPKGR